MLIRGAALSVPAVSLLITLFLYRSPFEGGPAFRDVFDFSIVELARLELLEELELDVLQELDVELYVTALSPAGMQESLVFVELVNEPLL